jgi:hypothetical protein
MTDKPMSINRAYIISDLRSDSGDDQAARAINYCAGTAEQRMKWLEKLAWACREKNSHKRNASLQITLAEMDASGESLAGMPWREYAA